MKRVLWVCVISLLLTGCAIREDEIDTRENRIYDWWEREETCIYKEEGSSVFFTACSIASDVFETIEYDYEKNTSRYQTRKETLERKKGVCVDTAILIYMNLRDAGFPDGEIGCLIFDNPIKGNPGHAVAAVFADKEKDDYYLLGGVSEDYILVMGFDLFEIWYYDEEGNRL